MNAIPTSLGKGIAGVAGLMAIVAFLAVPWISLGIFGNYTAAQVAQLASGELHTQQLAYFWLELLFPSIAVICVLLSFVVPGQRLLLAAFIMSSGTIAFLGVLGLYFFASQQKVLNVSLAVLISSGFWLYTVSVAFVAAGGVIQLLKEKTIVQDRGLDYIGVQRPDNRYS